METVSFFGPEFWKPQRLNRGEEKPWNALQYIDNKAIKLVWDLDAPKPRYKSSKLDSYCGF